MSPRARWLVAAAGAAFVAAALTGRGALFVRSWFVPVLAATGLALVAVAWRGTVRISTGAAVVLLVPAVVGLALSPAVAGRITTFAGTGAPVQARLGDGSNPLLAGAGGGTVTVLQIVLAQEQVGAVYLDGRPVTVDGVVDGHTLTRLVMVCCAADARPVSVPVRGPLPPQGTWVRVSGRLSATGGSLSIVARHVAAIPTPEDPFL